MIWTTAGWTWSKLVIVPASGSGAELDGGVVLGADAGGAATVVVVSAGVDGVVSVPPLDPHADSASTPVATMTQFRRDVMVRLYGRRQAGASGKTTRAGPCHSYAARVSRAFVGRRDELTQLVRATSSDDGAQVVLVEARPGYGKTALIDELVRRRAPMSAIRASPIALESTTSWAVLRALSRDWDVLPSAVAVAVGRAPADATVTPADVAYAWTELIRRRAEHERMMIVVDDLHWCDEASATVLGIAMREVGCTWVLGARPSSAAVEVDRLVPADRLTVVCLGPMRRSDLAELVATTVSGRWAPARIDEIVELCDGSPLLAIELARDLDSGRLDVAGRRPVTAVYGDRLDALREDERDIVALAALAFRPTLGLLAAARPGSDVVELLGAAERSGIVRVTGDVVGFEHPLCRHAVVDGLGTLQRAALHRELAALEPDTDRTVRHLALGTVLPDAAIADRLEDAAVEVRRRGAAADAAYLFERAFELTPESDVAVWRRRRARAAVACADADEVDRAASLLEGVSDVIGELDADLGPDVVAAIVMIADRRDGKPGADAAARRLLAGALEPRLRARLWRLIVRIHQFDDLRHAERMAVEAFDDARRTGGPDEILGARAVLANVRFLRGEDVPIDELLDEVERSTARRSEGTSAASLVQELLAWDDRFDAVRMLLAALEEAASSDASTAFRADLLAQASYVELRAGDVALAEKLADEAVELLHPRPGLEAFLVAETLLPIHGLRGDRAAVDAWIEAVSADIGAAPAIVQLLFHNNAGSARLSLGDVDASLGHLARARDLSAEVGQGDARSLPWAADLVDAQLLTGDLDGADETVAWLARASERSGSDVVRADRLRSGGLVEIARGDVAAGVATLAEAVEVAERTARPLVLARCLLALGSAVRRSGRRREARDVLVRARHVFSQLGAEPWVARVDDELRRAGYGAASPAAAELTATEHRVAELVSIGRSNREIAAELFVTVRTVESNLTRIYRKLGVRGRTELVARELR